MKKSIKVMFFFVILALLSVVAFSLCFTGKKQLKYKHTDDYAYVSKIDSILDQTKDNTNELYINLEKIGQKTTPYLVFEFKDGVDYNSIYEVRLYADTEYKIFQRLEYGFTYSKSGYLVVDLHDLKDIKAISIPNPISNNVKMVEFHYKPFTFGRVTIPFKTKWFAFIMLLAVIIDFTIVHLFDKYCIGEKTYKYFKVNYKKIVYAIGACTINAVLACLLEYLFCKIVVAAGFTTAFRGKRFVFLWLVLDIITWLFVNRKVFAKKTEKVFLGLILMLGMMYLFISPVYHNGWDIDTHYGTALMSAGLGEEYQTASDLLLTDARWISLPKKKYNDNLDVEKEFEKNYGDICEVTEGNISLTRLPSGIGIAIGRLFRLSYYATFILGEMFTLIIYSTLSYFAIKKLKSGKFIMSVIALIPTNIFMATCYNYDYWVLGFVYLGVAYFVSACQRDEYCTLRDEIICCVALMLSCVPKQNYILIMLLPFFMPLKKIKNKLVYYITAILPFVIIAISLYLRSKSTLTSVGDMRGGGGVNSSEQLVYLFTHITATIKLFFKYFVSSISLGYHEMGMTSYGNLAYSSSSFACLMIIAIIALIILDKSECDRNHSTLMIRLFCVFYYLIEIILIGAALYISFTPVGYEYINGVQPRYFTPLIPPIAMCIGSPYVRMDNKNKLGIFAFVIPSFVSFMGMIVVMLSRYI